MTRSSKKISRTIKLAKHTIRIKRADGGETDPMLDSDVKQTENPYKGQEISAKPPMPLGEYIARKIFSPKDESYSASDLGVVQGIKHLPQAALEAIQYPGAALKGELTPGYDPELKQFVGMTKSGMGPTQAAEVGSGLMMTGSLPSIARGAYNPNVMNVFAGPSSKTADLKALEIAKEMASKSAPREAIIGETKWFQGADGKWRYEIPDTNSKVVAGVGGHDLDDYLSHPELYAAYPHLKESYVFNAPKPPQYNPSLKGTFDPSTDAITIYGSNPEASRSTALHEIQHAIQAAEDFAPGSSGSNKVKRGSPAWDIYKEYTKGFTKEQLAQITPVLKEEAARQAYKRSAGEVESRNVQKRRDMTPEQLAQEYPWTTEDFPADQQLVRGTGGKYLSVADDVLQPMQAISSADTSLNQVPALFKSSTLNAKEGFRNLDIGGGRFDAGTNYLKNERGVESFVYDPYNRSPEHNSSVLRAFEQNPADSVTSANVLNVIAEPEARLGVIETANKYLAPGGAAHFSIYEGDKSGIGKQTTKGFQNNLPAAKYLAEVQKVFPDAYRKGNVIVAPKPGDKEPFADGGRVGFADGGAPWDVDLSTNPFEYNPNKGSNVPLANMNLYKGAALNTVPEVPAEKEAEETGAEAEKEEVYRPEGSGGSGESWINPALAPSVAPNLAQPPAVSPAVAPATSGIGNFISNKVQSAVNNPLSTAVNLGVGFVPGFGMINTLSGILGGPTVGGLISPDKSAPAAPEKTTPSKMSMTQADDTTMTSAPAPGTLGGSLNTSISDPTGLTPGTTGPETNAPGSTAPGPGPGGTAPSGPEGPASPGSPDGAPGGGDRGGGDNSGGGSGSGSAGSGGSGAGGGTGGGSSEGSSAGEGSSGGAADGSGEGSGSGGGGTGGGSSEGNSAGEGSSGGAADGTGEGSGSGGGPGSSGEAGVKRGGAITLHRHRAANGPIDLTGRNGKAVKRGPTKKPMPSNALINKALGVVSKKT